jgi:hypothetical protein
MKKWHETFAANIGLRALGIVLVGIGWLFALRLHHMALITGPRDPGAPMIILSAATFLSASAGSALLFVGPGLWESVEVSMRWRRLPPGVSDAPFSFEGDLQNPAGPPTGERSGA